MATTTLKQALILHQAGRLKEAEAGYRQALAEEPSDPDALHLLGLVAHQCGRHAEAIDLIQRAIATRPQPEFWYNLAQVHLARKDALAAEEAFRRTIAITPNHAEALFHLGSIRRERHDVTGAIDCYRRALEAKPALVDAHVNLGLLLMEAGDPAEAAHHLEAADRLRPNDPEILNNLGFVRKRIAPSRAIEDFRRALALDPRSIGATANLARLLTSLTRQGEAIEVLEATLNMIGDDADLRFLLASICVDANRLEDAIVHYEKAAAAEPHSARSLIALGNLHRRTGQFEKAYGYYKKAQELDPENCDAVVGILKHLKSRVPQDELARTAERADNPALPIEQRRQLHFALSECREAAGDYDAAFHHMDKGNALRRMELEAQSGPYDPGREAARVDRIIEAFDADYFRRVASFGITSELPVFIVGMPRSGTTLCEQILASHPQVFGADELPEIGRIARRLKRQYAGQPGAGHETGYAAHLDKDVAQSIAQHHLNRLRSLSPDASRIVDKMPMNYYWLGLIATLFPQSKIIRCRRDSMDVGLSCYGRNLAFLPIWASDLRAIGHVHRQHDRLMAHWQRVLPIQMLDLVYEDVVGDLEGSARRLIGYCGLPWENACLEFHRTDRLVKTASTEQVRQPIYRGSIGRWRRFERHLGPLREALSGTPDATDK